MNTRAMHSPSAVPMRNLRGGHCYYELGSPLWSHASTRRPTGAQTDREPHPLMVGSRMESVPAEHLDRVWPDAGPEAIVV
jgi:hypothetical protein